MDGNTSGAVILIAAAVVVDELGRTLVVRKRGTSSFMQPGGKIEPGETPFAALQREVLEELGVGIVPATARPLGRFCAAAANEPDHVVDAELFLVELAGAPRPTAEIEEITWVDPQSARETRNLAPLTRDVVLGYLRSRDGSEGGRAGRANGLDRRSDVLGVLADALIELRGEHPLRVAVDGITASGKTTLADELAAEVARRGVDTIRIRMDDFHHLREHRYRQGKDSARGYYDDAYDFDSLSRRVLTPLGPEGDRRYCRRVMDLASDTKTDDPPEVAPADAIVIVDGSFMQRHHRDAWDCVVFVDTKFPEALRRGVRRDGELLGGAAAAEDRFKLRYHAAAHMYVDDVDPARRADFVVDNDDLATPRLRRN